MLCRKEVAGSWSWVRVNLCVEIQLCVVLEGERKVWYDFNDLI